MEENGYKIITVDDEPTVHNILEKLIVGSGLTIEYCGSALSGREAIDLAKNVEPEIMILDIHMEPMDGFTLAEELYKILTYKPKVIFLTAYRRFGYVKRAIQLNAVDYLLKPTVEHDLCEVLERIVSDLNREQARNTEHIKLVERLRSVLPSAVSDVPISPIDRNAELARQMREYVDANYADDISLPSIADNLRLSSGYLGSIFKIETGISFRSYLRNVRIAKAIKLMVDQTLNFTEIAESVGFKDVNYFSQVFLQEVGVRPSEYRISGSKR